VNNFNIGIAGPPSGLSEFQVSEIESCLRDALRAVDAVTLCVWRDTGARHPVGSDHEDVMTACAHDLSDRFKTNISWYSYADGLRGVDLMLVCPASKSSKQKSRTQTLKNIADANHIRTRTICAWVTETGR
jgi:hypothetical protein